MSILSIEDSVLIIIDIQDKLLNAVFNKSLLEKKSEILAKAASILEIPTIVTEQYPKGLGETISAIKNNLSKNSKYYEKTNFNAIMNSEILDYLKSLNRKHAIVCGIETHICVHQTVDALLENGFNVTLAKDVCGSRSETEYLSGIEVMRNNGTQIKTTEMILFELLKGAKHPKFKEIQTLIK